jgi:hypothetical protein
LSQFREALTNTALLFSMSQEDVPIEFVLEGIESIMASSKQPRVILFDIGGVCVSVLYPFSVLEVRLAAARCTRVLGRKYPSNMLKARVYPSTACGGIMS